jgi:hypothetical protein
MVDLRVITVPERDPRDVDLAARHARNLASAWLQSTIHTEPLTDSLTLACRRILAPLEHATTKELTAASGRLIDLLTALATLAGSAVIEAVCASLDELPAELPYRDAHDMLDAITEALAAARHVAK